MGQRRAHDGINVMGVPRSGTTLLRGIGDAHRDIACPRETNLLSAFVVGRRIGRAAKPGPTGE